MLLLDPPSHCYIMVQKEKPFGTLPPIIVLFCKHFSYMTTEEYGPVERHTICVPSSHGTFEKSKYQNGGYK